MEPETTVDIELDGDLVVEVDFSSTRENSCEATRSILATEVATLETSTLLVARGNALVPVKGEDAYSAASFFAGPSKEIA